MRSKRPGVAPRRAVGEHVDRGVEPDGDRPLVEQLARARIDEHAAAGRDHPDLAVDQARDQPPLAVAEILLAVALEHFGGGEAGGVLDRRVAVDEGQAEPLGEPAADGRLAGAHQPDEDDRTVETVCQLSHAQGLYSGGQGGKSGRVPILSTAREQMPRALIVLLVLVLLLLGLMFFFSSQADEVPTSTIEVEVKPLPMRS